MQTTFLINLGAALLMGVAIGLERQYRQHPAGLRTNALVCVGAALFVSLPGLWGHDLSPDRIVGQVVTGVGFLGGGVILREGLNVKGMNTAATLWCSAAVGALTGAGYPLYGAVGTGVVLAMHLGLRPVARWIDAHTRKAADVETSYRIHVVCEHRQEAVVRTILMRHVSSHPSLILQGIALQDGTQPDQATVTADIFSASRNDRAMEDLTSRINIEPGVTSVRWEQGR
jgi:putative Mg2+ transporter-C (MgtC) family protein